MITDVYRYSFKSIPFEEAEASFVLAIMAAESLHGDSEVRLQAAHAVDINRRLFVIDASTPVGHDLNRLFVGFLSREFGPEAFSVERVGSGETTAAPCVAETCRREPTHS